MKRIGYSSAMMIALSLALTSAAYADPNSLRAANLSTAMEAALATTSLVTFKNSGNPGRYLASASPPVKGDWDVRFSPSNWVLMVRGIMGDDKFDYAISGFLWSGDNGDYQINFAGTGNFAKESLAINGKAVWKYDSKLSDHEVMEFDNLVKFGENSSWGWIRGAEIIVGGVIGGVGGIIAVAATPAAVITGLAGAVGGAASLVSLSDVAKEFVYSDETATEVSTIASCSQEG